MNYNASTASASQKKTSPAQALAKVRVNTQSKRADERRGRGITSLGSSNFASVSKDRMMMFTARNVEKTRKIRLDKWPERGR
jgi:hypothetical protein